MRLEHVADIDLPPHTGRGGFDHAAVHGGRGLIYVAHTANDAVDVIDAGTRRCLRSIPGLAGVAGALVDDEGDRVFTSNRGENTISIVPAAREGAAVKVKVGHGPNGLAYDPRRQLLLAANVGDPAVAGSHTVSLVDVPRAAHIVDIPVAGRTRWTVFDATSGAFYVNIADPPRIEVVDVEARKLVRSLAIPAAGPHGLDIDSGRRRLFCACDAQTLVLVDIESGGVVDRAALSGVPDVIFFNAQRRHLYVAIGEPGVIDVFDTDTLRRLEIVETGRGAHTLAFDAPRDTVYAFLPESHSAAIFVDRG